MLEQILAAFGQLAGYPLGIAAALLLTTFVTEDGATAGGALLAAHGVVDPILAFLAVNLGIVIGDAGLYALGHLAARGGWAKRLLERRHVFLAKNFLEERKLSIWFSSRFIPGTRLPTYTASGFFALPFMAFLLTLITAALVWTGLIFTLVLTLGAMVMDELGPWRWAGAAVIVLAVFVIPRLIVRRPAFSGHGGQS